MNNSRGRWWWVAVVLGGGRKRRARTSERITNDSVHTKKQSVTSWPRLRDSRA